jgi:fumarylacetoacetase
VLSDALAPFKLKGIENDVEVLPYLKENDSKSVFDIRLNVDLKSKANFTSEYVSD